MQVTQTIKPDTRISFGTLTVNDETIENRYSYHAPKGDQAERYTFLRKKCAELARTIVQNTPASWEQTRCLDALDQVMFLANAAIARNE